MKLSFLVLCVSFLSYQACNSSGDVIKENQTALAGMITNNDTIEIPSIKIRSNIDIDLGFYYVDDIGGNPIFPSKGLPFTIESSYPVYLMQPDERQIGYYLSPGDSVEIQKDEDGRMSFVSGEPLKNSEINFFNELTNETGSIRYLGKYTYLKKPVTMEERDKLIEKKYEERRHYLETYKKKYPLSNQFIGFAEKSILYARIYEKLYLFYTGYDKIKIRDYYLDSMNTYVSYFNSDSCLYNPFFKDALVQVTRIFEKQKSQNNSPSVFWSGLSNAELLSIYERVMSSFRGKVKNYLLTAITNQLISQKRISESRADSLAKNIDDIKLRGYIEKRIQNLYKKPLTLSMSQQKLIDLDSNVIAWDKLISSHKNTVLYIDVWASWCKPCLAEMPASRDLKNKFKTKPIKFIYFSADEEYNKWKKASATYSIMEESYLVEGDFVSPFAQKFHLSSVPRYIIIDKNGKVFTDDAMRPGDRNLIPVLDKLVSQ